MDGVAGHKEVHILFLLLPPMHNQLPKWKGKYNKIILEVSHLL